MNWEFLCTHHPIMEARNSMYENFLLPQFISSESDVRRFRYGQSVFLAERLYSGPVEVKRYVAYMQETTTMLYYPSPDSTSIVAALDADLNYTLTGIGKTVLQERHLRIVHNPEMLIQRVQLKKGLTVFMHFTIAPDLLAPFARWNAQLGYFVEQLHGNKESGIQQMAVRAEDQLVHYLYNMKRSSFHKLDESSLLDKCTHLVDTYVGALFRKQASKHMIADDLDTFKKLSFHAKQNIHYPVSMRELQDIAGCSDATIRKAYEGAIGQKPLEFHHELSVAYVTDLLLNTEGDIREVLSTTGYKYDWVAHAIKVRHGYTPTEIRQGKCTRLYKVS